MANELLVRMREVWHAARGTTRPTAKPPARLDEELAKNALTILSRWTSPARSYNPDDDLIGLKGMEVYEKMRRDDQVKAALAFKKSAVLSTGWEVHPASDNKKDKEAADFITWCLENLDPLYGSVDDILYEQLSALDFGFSVAELILKKLDTGPFSGKVGLRTIKVRKPHEFVFDVDEFDNLRPDGLRQSFATKGYPLEKFLIFSYQREFGNFRGISDLRAAYRPWWLKDNLWSWAGVYAERFAIPIATASYPPGTYPEGHPMRALIASIHAAIGNLQANTALTFPSDFDLKLHEASGQGVNVLRFLFDHCNLAIARSILMPSQLGFSAEGSTGSFARSKVQFDAFMLIVDDLRRDLADDVINGQFIPRLIGWNFSGLEAMPRFDWLPFTESDEINLLNTWMLATQYGLVTPTPADETHIRAATKFPEREISDEEEAAVQAKNDAAVKKIQDQADATLNPPEPTGWDGGGDWGNLGLGDVEAWSGGGAEGGEGAEGGAAFVQHMADGTVRAMPQPRRRARAYATDPEFERKHPRVRNAGILKTRGKAYAVDPEFEAKHPRDSRGRWANKPDVPDDPTDPTSTSPVERYALALAAAGENTERAQWVVDGLPPELRDVLTPTILRYRRADGSWDPARRAEQERWMQTLVDAYRQPPEEREAEARGDKAPTLFLLAGGAGSGKTTALNQLRTAGQDLGVVVSADDLKERFMPEWSALRSSPYWKAGGTVVHEESSALAKELVTRCIRERRNIVFDATLKSYETADRLFRFARAHGYEIQLLYVDVDPTVAAARADVRAAQSGRWVPSNFLRRSHEMAPAAFREYSGLVDRWIVYRSEGRPGEQIVPPRRVAGDGQRQAFFIEEESLWRELETRAGGAIRPGAATHSQRPSPPSGNGSAATSPATSSAGSNSTSPFASAPSAWPRTSAPPTGEHAYGDDFELWDPEFERKHPRDPHGRWIAVSTTSPNDDLDLFEDDDGTQRGLWARVGGSPVFVARQVGERLRDAWLRFLRSVRRANRLEDPPWTDEFPISTWAEPRAARTLAAPSDFEAQHPRGGKGTPAGGRFVEKPGGKKGIAAPPSAGGFQETLAAHPDYGIQQAQAAFAAMTTTLMDEHGFTHAEANRFLDSAYGRHLASAYVNAAASPETRSEALVRGVAAWRRASTYVADPAFETKHPRDPKGTAKGGKFRKKPAATPAPALRHVDATDLDTAEGRTAFLRGLVQTFGMTEAQAARQLEELEALNARLAGPTPAEPTAAQAAGTTPGTTFPGRCYEMAGRYILDRGDDADVQLVHGTVNQSPFDAVRIGHAWIETTDGKVFDGTTQQWYERDSYYRVFNAEAERTYTATEARAQLLRTRNWGCWHMTAGIVNDQPRGARRRPRRRAP